MSLERVTAYSLVAIDARRSSPEGIRTEEVTYRLEATALAEGFALRATGRLLALDKDTWCSWLPGLSLQCQGVMNKLR